MHVLCFNHLFDNFQMSSSEEGEDMFDDVNEEEEDNDEASDEDDVEEVKIAEQQNDIKCKIEKKVIDRINALFEADLSNLHKITDLQQELFDKFDDLDRKLNVANAETPSQLHKSLRTGETMVMSGCGAGNNIIVDIVLKYFIKSCFIVYITILLQEMRFSSRYQSCTLARRS